MRFVAIAMNTSDLEGASVFVDEIVRESATDEDARRARTPDFVEGVLLFERGAGARSGLVRLVCWNIKHQRGCRCAGNYWQRPTGALAALKAGAGSRSTT